MTQQQCEIVLAALDKASNRWKEGFNSGNAAQCAEQYEDDAVMQAKPFGTFTGTAEITAFWQQLIDGGYSDVEYVEPNIEVLDEKSALLTSKWTMNKAAGVISRELWVLQEDGTAKLREDAFEAQS
ncbi:MAG: ketosteroid isomerase-like protein [Oceanospirillaceae bacterium]|jgi:ketosteroid isomerase-like protein